MATVIQAKPSRGELTKQAVGQGLANLISSGSQAYMKRADESAIQKAITDLGPKASARDILNALTNTQTYNAESKQNALSNYLGVEKFEELKRHAQETEALQKAQLDATQNKLTKEKEDKIEEQNKADAIIDQIPNLTDEQRATLKGKIGLKGAEGLLKDSLKPKKDTEKDKTDDQQKADAIIDQLESLTPEKKASLKGRVSLKTAEDMLKEDLKPKKGPSAVETRRIEKIRAARSGLNIIERMKEIGKGGNLGRGSGVLKHIGGQTARDFGEYERLGKSIIQLASPIVIRNRQEFETLAHDLYDPTIPDSQREGILDAMTRIISENIDEEEALVETPPVQNKPSPASETKRPPLSSFKR